MSKHTKGELECGKDAALWIGNIKICTLAYPMVFHKGGPIDINEDIAQANAEHLVKCWNCHDELVAACRKLISCSDLSCAKCEDECCDEKAPYNLAKAVLAKAKE